MAARRSWYSLSHMVVGRTRLSGLTYIVPTQGDFFPKKVYFFIFFRIPLIELRQEFDILRHADNHSLRECSLLCFRGSRLSETQGQGCLPIPRLHVNACPRLLRLGLSEACAPLYVVH